MKRISFLTLLLVCLAFITLAQDVKDVDAAYSDFSIPDASAFSLLGVNPNKVTKPSSTKELSASLLNITSSYKTISPGFALEWAPFMTFGKKTIDATTKANIDADFDTYKKKFFFRNIQISSASVKDLAGTKFALGINAAIFDHTDPKYDKVFVETVFSLLNENSIPLILYIDTNNVFIKKRNDFYSKLNIAADTAYTKLIVNPLAISSKELTNGDIVIIQNTYETNLGKRYNDTVKNNLDAVLNAYNNAYKAYKKALAMDNVTLAKLLKKEREDFKKKNWNAGVLKFGFGNIWNSPDDSWKKLASQRFVGYGVWAFKLCEFGQGIFLGQYNYNNSNDSLNKTQFLLGGRLIAGSANIHGSLEGVWQANTYRTLNDQQRPNDKTLRSTIGIEFKINEGFWAEFAIGVNGLSKDFFKNASALSLANIKYTFSKEKPRFDIR